MSLNLVLSYERLTLVYAEPLRLLPQPLFHRRCLLSPIFDPSFLVERPLEDATTERRRGFGVSASERGVARIFPDLFSRQLLYWYVDLGCYSNRSLAGRRLFSDLRWDLNVYYSWLARILAQKLLRCFTSPRHH